MRLPAPARSRLPRPRARQGVRGVSLIELIVVIVLVGLMSLMAASAMGGGFKGIELRSAAKEVAAQLRHARTRAIATGQTQRFAIDPRTRAWEGADGRSGTLPATLGVTFTGAREVQPRPGAGAILFFSDGASTGGRVRLSRDTAAWDVDVKWLTGEVRLARAGDAR